MTQDARYVFSYQQYVLLQEAIDRAEKVLVDVVVEECIDTVRLREGIAYIGDIRAASHAAVMDYDKEVSDDVGNME